MKKTLLTLAFVFAAFFALTINTNAEEIEPATAAEVPAPERERIDPEVKFQEHVDNMTANHEANIEQATANYEENLATALERIAFKKDLVAEFASEMSGLYEIAWDDHIAVHELLFNIRMDIRETAFTNYLDGLIELKEELFPVAETGEMTYKEVFESLRTYSEETKAANEVIREEAQSRIDELDAAWEVNKEIVDGLKAELRAAIEAEDVDTANAIIVELYDYLVLHVQYDNDKLVVLESVEF